MSCAISRSKLDKVSTEVMVWCGYGGGFDVHASAWVVNGRMQVFYRFAGAGERISARLNSGAR